MSEHEVSWRKESRKVCLRLESHESSYIVYDVWILNKAFYLLTYLCVCVLCFLCMYLVWAQECLNAYSCAYRGQRRTPGIFHYQFPFITVRQGELEACPLSSGIYLSRPLVLWLRQIRVCPTFYVDTLTWTLVFKLAVQAKLTMSHPPSLQPLLLCSQRGKGY